MTTESIAKLQLALGRLAGSRAYARRATDDQEQADRSVAESALDLLQAMAESMVTT